MNFLAASAAGGLMKVKGTAVKNTNIKAIRVRMTAHQHCLNNSQGIIACNN